MNRLIHRVIVPLVMGLVVLASVASADPIILTYTSESGIVALLPPGTTPQDFIVGIAEFGDFGTDPTPDFPADFNLSFQGNGSIVQVGDPGGSEFFWNTTGPISFSLDSGTANAFVVSYLTLPAGQPAPSVSMTRADGSSFEVGPLVGGPFEAPGELFFAFTSTEPFTRVSLGLGANEPLQTQFVAFANVPNPVPEPSTLLLMSTGALLLSRRRLLRAVRP
jgi:hypothetical protein